jgi:hypothetical protein
VILGLTFYFVLMRVPRRQAEGHPFSWTSSI